MRSLSWIYSWGFNFAIFHFLFCNPYIRNYTRRLYFPIYMHSHVIENKLFTNIHFVICWVEMTVFLALKHKFWMLIMHDVSCHVQCIQGSSVDGEVGTSASTNDRLHPSSAGRPGGKASGRAAKQRAIARGDNLAPAQVSFTPPSLNIPPPLCVDPG